MFPLTVKHGTYVINDLMINCANRGHIYGGYVISMWLWRQIQNKMCLIMYIKSLNACHHAS